MSGRAPFMGEKIEHARRTLTARFRAAHIEAAELDVRVLMCAALGLDLSGLIASAARGLTRAEADRLQEFAIRRLSGEPVARIVGEREFWGLPLKLSAATLVPRPDTETVVELALETIRPSLHCAVRIGDIGTGSGAILLALLHEVAEAFGVGTDISPDALRTARRNAAELGLLPRAAFVVCDYAAALGEAFELIVSNPPYIATGDIAGLATEVRDHDPLAALDGGADGLDAYRALIPQAAALLAPGGALVVEAGQDQAEPIQALMAAAGLIVRHPAKTDLAGVPRAVSGLKRPR